MSDNEPTEMGFQFMKAERERAAAREQREKETAARRAADDLRRQDSYPRREATANREPVFGPVGGSGASDSADTGQTGPRLVKHGFRTDNGERFTFETLTDDSVLISFAPILEEFQRKLGATQEEMMTNVLRAVQAGSVRARGHIVPGVPSVTESAADAIIRLFQWADTQGVDLAAAVVARLNERMNP